MFVETKKPLKSHYITFKTLAAFALMHCLEIKKKTKDIMMKTLTE